MSTIRFAILTAVSTKEQARADKISLEFQENANRTAALAQGWFETAGPFKVDGYSRSFYTGLPAAEQDIPPLHDALEAARAGQYDVLVVYTYDRLGDLTPMISNEFRNIRRQIYSVSQSSAVQDPESYDPYSDESSQIQQDVARITQRFRINDLRRKWRAGVPKRLVDGLTPLKVPFGYRWTGKKEPPALDEQQAALIYQMRDNLFAGLSMREIARRADESGILPPNGGKKWDPSSITYILGNRYYAGLLTLHKTRTMYDATRKRKHRAIRQAQDKWQTGQGKHHALWPESMYYRITSELERRRLRNVHYALRFPLSGLLTCSVCGKKLHRRTHGAAGGRRKMFSCRYGPAHVIMPYEQAVERVGLALRDAIREKRAAPAAGAPDGQAETVQAALDELAGRRKRILDGHESGVYTDVEAAERIADIEKTADSLLHQLEQTRRDDQVASEFIDALDEQDIEDFPVWMATEEPSVVNRVLSALCEKIELTPEGKVNVDFRKPGG